MRNERKYIVIDNESGEISGEIAPSEWAKVRWLRRGEEIPDKQEEETEKTDVRYKKFCMINQEKRDLVGGLSVYAKAMLLSFEMNIEYNTGIVKYKRRTDIKHADLCEMTGLSSGSVSRASKELEEHNIIIRDGRRIYVNPDVISKGRKTDREVSERFEQKQAD